jgi:hypothetical protein
VEFLGVAWQLYTVESSHYALNHGEKIMKKRIDRKGGRIKNSKFELTLIGLPRLIRGASGDFFLGRVVVLGFSINSKCFCNDFRTKKVSKVNF